MPNFVSVHIWKVCYCTNFKSSFVSVYCLINQSKSFQAGRPYRVRVPYRSQDVYCGFAVYANPYFTVYVIL